MPFKARKYGNFSETATPLYELLKKKKLFECSVSCEKSFTEIREKMATRPVLYFPDFSLPFELFVDASEIDLGAVLQQTVEGSERVVSFAVGHCTNMKRTIQPLKRRC